VTPLRAYLLFLALALAGIACLAAIACGCADYQTRPTIAPFDAVWDGYDHDRAAAVHAYGKSATMGKARVATAMVLSTWGPALWGVQAVVQAEQAGLDPLPAYCAARPAWAERGIHTDDSPCVRERLCWIGTHVEGPHVDP